MKVIVACVTKFSSFLAFSYGDADPSDPFIGMPYNRPQPHSRSPSQVTHTFSAAICLHLLAAGLYGSLRCLPSPLPCTTFNNHTLAQHSLHSVRHQPQ